MIPWIYQRFMTAESEQGYPFIGSDPVFALTALLQEITGRTKKNLMVMTPPRSVVFYGSDEGHYLFREGSRVPFASFSSYDGLSSVNFRYNDPMDPNSGKRTFSLLTGWQGTAELLASAMRQSKSWKDLETVQTGIRRRSNHLGTTRMQYIVWATPRQDMTFTWSASTDRKATTCFAAGKVTLRRNKPVRLARVEVIVGKDGSESVIATHPYPDFSGEQSDDEGHYRSLIPYFSPSWQPLSADEDVKLLNTQAATHVDLSESHLTRYRPHDDFEINWR
jgi:hypothetical protein